MRGFFPTQTGIWKLEEPPAFRRLSMSLVEMAAITGVVMRLYRAFSLTHGPTDSWVYIALTFGAGMALLFGMATLHLGNFTVRHWLWRAPAFAAVEALAEALASLGLVALGREPLGTSRATFAEWGGIARDIAFWRILGICLFALLLAGMVQVVRVWLLRQEHRGHTVDAVHHEREMIKREHAQEERHRS
jgi:hypothetical protein